MSTAPVEPAPWWEAFPAPKSQCPAIEPEKVKDMLERQKTDSGVSRDFLLVDVRRTDWEGGTISSSINLPAHSLYPTRRIVYELCKQAKISKIIFYCGASNGRGPRCANWMQDFLNDVGAESPEAFVLKGGIKGWVKAFNGAMMDAFEEKYWEQFT